MSILSSNDAGNESIIKEWFNNNVVIDIDHILIDKDINNIFSVDILGNVTIEFYKGSIFPKNFKFRHIRGNFSVSYCDIKSIELESMVVDGDFSCFECRNIKSVKGIPRSIGRDCIIRKCGKTFSESEIRDNSRVGRSVYCK